MRVVVFLVLFGSALAVPRSPNRIVGGTPTTIDHFPYMANMQYAYFGYLWSQACGGALIKPSTILSASHCYWGDLQSEWRVRLGTSFPDTGGTVYEISEIILHPDYLNATLDHDVAIVHLSTPAVLSSTVATVSIAGANFNLDPNTPLTNIGWGVLTYNGSYPSQLQQVEVFVIDQDICTERYVFLRTQPGFADYYLVTPRMFCSGILDVGGADSCNGDSGGPVLHNNTVVGIVSWGFECANSFYPAVNTRVSSFTKWIADNA